MAEGAADVLPRAAIRGLIEHISRRLYLLLAVFVAGMVGGYPLAGDAIEWLMQADGYLPEGVQVIILQPMEVVLLRLRIAANIGIALVVLTMLCDIGWNGRKILSDAYRRKFVPTGGGFGGLLFALTCSSGLGPVARCTPTRYWSRCCWSTCPRTLRLRGSTRRGSCNRGLVSSLACTSPP